MPVKEKLMKLGNRIKEAREAKQLTQNELVKLSGVSRASLQLYEADKGNITLDNLEKIANALNIDISFFVSPSNVSKSSENVSYLSPTLSLSNKKDVSKSQNPSKTLSDKNKLSIHSTTDELSNNDDLVSIPFLESITASAGDGAYNDNEDSEQLTFQKSFLRQYFGIISFNNLSIIIGKGDSMYPTLPESCYLLVQLGNVNDGEICIARIDDELYVKRLQKRPKLKLFSDNKNYEPIELEGENFEILGSVVGYFKKTAL